MYVNYVLIVLLMIFDNMYENGIGIVRLSWLKSIMKH